MQAGEPLAPSLTLPRPDGGGNTLRPGRRHRLRLGPRRSGGPQGGQPTMYALW